MPPTKSAPDVDFSAPTPDPVQTREQLNRLLAHPLFSNSKRYPALLAYVVEQTLLGHSADLKERSIAVEVFGRDPAYDANADPVVRITAGEVRKRLSQYYYDPAHTGEPVVELPLGSYVPVFRLPDAPPSAPAVPTDTEFIPAEPAPEPQRRSWYWFAAGAVALVAGAVGVGLGLRYRAAAPPPPPTPIERFWAPVLQSANTTTFCLGEPAKNIDSASVDDYNAPVNKPEPEKLYVRLHYSGNLSLADVITLTRTVAALESHHKPFRVVPASEATFPELREGPIVLIGAFDNIWTLRVTQKLSRDYAIVARIHDQTTGQPVIIAAGISEEGTEAAGEILYNPVYLDTLVAHLPAGWEDKDLEAVIETQVIQGHSGPPNILAVETW